MGISTLTTKIPACSVCVCVTKNFQEVKELSSQVVAVKLYYIKIRIMMEWTFTLSLFCLASFM